MAYRRTDAVVARLNETRERIVAAALKLVAQHGYDGAGIPAIAEEAGLSTGALYRYFPSKADLFDEVFRRASQREIDVCAAAAQTPGSARERLARVVQVFARRALKGRRLAYALLAEPVDPLIEADRLRYRIPYRDIFVGIIEDGIEAGDIAAQDAVLTASAIVGALNEALIGPLAPQARKTDQEQLIAGLALFCVQALGPMPARKS
ncbi:MAG TPA: TetR/AcrR family transcriptional regulator [Ferrovibrio sp.]|uniref:TetR/AcrR family transcriptional regulator n=1 Tax=Ferrovibrio sp. TaxID=1917215 RepID=UPI002ED161F0